MKPVFCGNLEYDTHPSDLEQLFSKFGRVDRVDVKYGYAFIYFEDERDADYAIRNLDSMPFGYERRKLSVEWSRGERGARHREGSRSRNTRPTKTLFIINFDPIRTRPSDIEWHFEPYGKIISVRIRKNFAFVQFETQSEATKALECTNMSKILDQVITVDYALSDDGDRGDDRGGSPRRGYRGRGAGPYGRSMSPLYHRGRRFSPDYARRSSPEYGRRSSPIYGRSRSPVYDPYDGPVRQRGRNAACGRY